MGLSDDERPDPEKTPLGTGLSDLASGFALLALVIGLTAGFAHVSHDLGTLLDVGGRLADGQMPYVDYVETNPPLAHYLHAAVVLLSRVLPLGPIGTLWALTVLGLVVNAVVLRGHGPRIWGDRTAANITASMLAVHLFTAAVGNFGQREQLFVLLYTPWLVYRAGIGEGVVARWGPVAAAFAAVGVCIKPHFLLVPLLVEGWNLLRLGRRGLEASLGVFVAVGLVYPIHFLFLPEAMTTAYFDVWVPRLLQGYGALGEPATLRQLLAPFWVTAGVLSVIGLILPQRSLALAGVAGLLCTVLQGKYFYYHMIPGLTFGMAASVFWVERVRNDALVFGIRLMGGLLLLLATVVLFAGWVPPRGHPALEAFARHIHAGDTVLSLNTELSPTYAGLYEAGAVLTSKYPHHFPFFVFWPEGHKGPFTTVAHEAERRFRVDLADDLAERPLWVLVEVPCVHCKSGVTIHGYLDDIGLGAVLSRDWKKVESAGGMELWRRQDSPGR